MSVLVINFIVSIVAGGIGKDVWVVCRVRVLHYKPKKKKAQRGQECLSSFHTANRMLLPVNPTHPFTDDPQNCMWAEQVATNSPRGLIASDCNWPGEAGSTAR